MLEDSLKGIGFNKKEAKVYLACLELGTSKPSQIGDKSGLNRITAYEILKRLKEKGVVLEIVKNNVKFYSAINPETVISQARASFNSADKALPELLALYNLRTKKPRVLFYEGMTGIKKIYEDSLNSKTEILTFSNAKNLYKVLGDFNDYYVKQRMKRKINLKAVALADKSGDRAKKEGEKVLRKVRLVSPAQYDFTNEIMIYDDKVAIVSLLEKIGVIVESKDMVKTQREIFKIAWEYAGKFSS